MAEIKMDRRDASELIRIVKELVALLHKYIKLGFSTREIAETFAAIFFHVFSETVDDEELVCLQRELPKMDQIYSSKSRFEATSRMCLNMASGFMQNVAKAMGQNHNRT